MIVKIVKLLISQNFLQIKVFFQVEKFCQINAIKKIKKTNISHLICKYSVIISKVIKRNQRCYNKNIFDTLIIIHVPLFWVNRSFTNHVNTKSQHIVIDDFSMPFRFAYRLYAHLQQLSKNIITQILFNRVVVLSKTFPILYQNTSL